MKTVSLFSLILKQTKTGPYLASFAGIFLVCAVLFWILDPEIETLSDGIWFAFMLVTTIGFGDYTATTLASRALAVFLGLYGVISIGFICGVGSSWLFEKVRASRNESVALMVYQLEHLDELSEEQISDLEHKIVHLQTSRSNKAGSGFPKKS